MYKLIVGLIMAHNFPRASRGNRRLNHIGNVLKVSDTHPAHGVFELVTQACEVDSSIAVRLGFNDLADNVLR